MAPVKLTIGKARNITASTGVDLREAVQFVIKYGPPLVEAPTTTMAAAVSTAASSPPISCAYMNTLADCDGRYQCTKTGCMQCSLARGTNSGYPEGQTKRGHPTPNRNDAFKQHLWNKVFEEAMDALVEFGALTSAEWKDGKVTGDLKGKKRDQIVKMLTRVEGYAPKVVRGLVKSPVASFLPVNRDRLVV